MEVKRRMILSVVCVVASLFVAPFRSTKVFQGIRQA
jgi:hypothetical protein